MVRAGSGKTQAGRRKRMRKLTKGFRASRHNLFRMAHCTLIRARAFAFRDRRVKKRHFRRLWIIRINAAARMRGLRYSELIAGLQRAMCMLDRKALSEVAIHDPAAFDQIVELAKKNLPPALAEQHAFKAKKAAAAAK